MSGTWNKLAATAQLGTARQTFAPPDDAGPLTDGMRSVIDASPDPAAALLTCAAMALQYDRSTFVPTVCDGTIIEPAEIAPGGPPVAPPTAADRLGVILGRGLRLAEWRTHADNDDLYDGLLREWIALALRAGVRAPARLVRSLLEIATRRLHDRGPEGGRLNDREAEIITAVPGLIGAGGRWLASHNPEWEWAAREPFSAEPWLARREVPPPAALRWLRTRDPAAARDAFQPFWKGAKEGIKSRILLAMETGLGEADAPWLEELLGEKDNYHRSLASGFLARLPHSARARRMEERLRKLVRVERGGPPDPVGPGGMSLVVGTHLDSRDEAMERDRLLFNHDGSEGPVDVETSLGGMASSVRTDFWSELTGLDPEAFVRLLIEAAPRGEQTVTHQSGETYRMTAPAGRLLLGVNSAARDQGDHRWGAALLGTLPRDHWKPAGLAECRFRPVYALDALDARERSDWQCRTLREVIAHARTSPTGAARLGWKWMGEGRAGFEPAALPLAWEAYVLQAATATPLVAQNMRGEPVRMSITYDPIALQLVFEGDPESLPELRRMHAEHWNPESPCHSMLEDMLMVLDFRRMMREEFSAAS